MPQQVLTLTREKDCKHSVRFKAPEPQSGDEPNAIDSLYVSRAFAGVNKAQEITVTIEVAD